MTEEMGIIPITGTGHLQAINDLFASRGTFVDMVGALGLDRAIDFQRSNLRGVDFTNSDLRGFDFSGADLRGSFGINIAYDETTRLDDADVEASPFRHVVLERYVRENNTTFEHEYHILKNAYWADQLPYVLDRVKKSTNAIDARLMAMRLFVDAKDGGVRGDMIRVLGTYVLDREEYLSFLLNVCAIRKEPVVLVAAIDVLSALYRDRKPAFDTLMALTSHESEAVRIAAYEGVVRSKHLKQAHDDFATKLAAGVTPRIRRAIANKLAPTVVPFGRAIMAHEPFARAIAFNEPITDKLINAVGFDAHGGERYYRSLVSEAIQLIEALIDLGMPFRMVRLDTRPNWQAVAQRG